MGTLKPGSPAGIPAIVFKCLSHFLQPAMIWCRSSERSTPGEPEKAAPPEDCFFLAYISPMTMRKEEPDVYCWDRKGAEPPPSCQFVFGRERKEEQILIPKNGWASAKWSAGIIRPTMVFCGYAWPQPALTALSSSPPSSDH